MFSVGVWSRCSQGQNAAVVVLGLHIKCSDKVDSAICSQWNVKLGEYLPSGCLLLTDCSKKWWTVNARCYICHSQSIIWLSLEFCSYQVNHQNLEVAFHIDICHCSKLAEWTPIRIVMPMPPLGSARFMFSCCPFVCAYVRLSIHPSVRGVVFSTSVVCTDGFLTHLLLVPLGVQMIT